MTSSSRVKMRPFSLCSRSGGKIYNQKGWPASFNMEGLGELAALLKITLLTKILIYLLIFEGLRLWEFDINCQQCNSLRVCKITWQKVSKVAGMSSFCWSESQGLSSWLLPPASPCSKKIPRRRVYGPSERNHVFNYSTSCTNNRVVNQYFVRLQAHVVTAIS